MGEPDASKAKQSSAEAEPIAPCLLVTLGSALPGQDAPKPARPNAALASAIACTQRGDYEEAVPLYEQAQTGLSQLSKQNQDELASWSEYNRKALRARRGDHHTAAARAFGAALDPAELEQAGGDRGGQGAVQVPPALGPVDALSREAPARPPHFGHIHTERSQRSRSGPGNCEACAGAVSVARSDQ